LQNVYFSAVHSVAQPRLEMEINMNNI